MEPTTSCNYSCITCIRHSWGDEIGLDWIYISLDGPDEDCFSRIRPGASFEDVTRNYCSLPLNIVIAPYSVNFPQVF